MQNPPVDNTSSLNIEVNKIVQAARPILASAITTCGEFSMVATFVQCNINRAIEELMKESNGNNDTIDQDKEPAVYLLLANCILYATVIAFFLVNGWKKKSKRQSRETKPKEKRRGVYEAGAIRKNISIAKAEIEKLKANKKMTKKGKKN